MLSFGGKEGIVSTVYYKAFTFMCFLSVPPKCVIRELDRTFVKFFKVKIIRTAVTFGILREVLSS